MHACPPFDAVVLDLDGVVLQSGWEAALTDRVIDRSAWVRFWIESGWGAALSTGSREPEGFAADAVEAFDLSLSPAEFLAFFTSWIVGPYPGALELLAELRRTVTVGCLSNTNAPFVARYRDELGLPGWFDRCYFSNEIGLCKPEPAVFEHVIADLGVAPGRLLYLDDAERHVASARGLGIVAECVQGIDEARQALVRHGFALTQP